MAQDKIFVGRKAELEQFKKVLEDLKGQAVLVVGHRGMGKTWLVNKMAEIGENHPKLKCGCVRYEVTPTDSVDSTMALMMDNAFEAAQVTESSFDSTPRRLRQWKALLNVIKIGDLMQCLCREPTKNTREQFLEKVQLISKRMPENGRAIFIIDPEKYMQKDSDQSWSIVVRELPDKIKLIFAQRTEDVLVESRTFAALDNISRIPEKTLGILEEQAVDELLDRRVTDIAYPVTEVRRILNKYKGHPYALQGALDLLKAGTKLEELPQDPTGIATAQWKELCKRGKDAIRLFKTYAILEVGVPNEVVVAVSELDTDTLHSVLANDFLSGLLCEEGYGKRIYHAILSDYILDQMGEDEKRVYHHRCEEIFRNRLNIEIKPDALSASRLPWHVLPGREKHTFVNVFLDEVSDALMKLGLFDDALMLARRALSIVEPESSKEARVLIMLAFVLDSLGQLDGAEFALQKAVEISQAIGDIESMAIEFGNLGVVYQKKGDLEKAEAMYKKALETNKKIGRKCGMQADYTNLSILYSELGKLTEAEDMLRKVQQVSEFADYRVIGATYVELGMARKKNGRLDQSEEYLRNGLQWYEKRGDIEGKAACAFNLATVLCMRGDINGGEDMMRRALKDFEIIENESQIAKSSSILGSCRVFKGDLGEALRFFSKALCIYERKGQTKNIAEQCVNIAGLYAKQGCKNKALAHWQKALEIFNKIGMKTEIEKTQKSIDELKDK